MKTIIAGSRTINDYLLVKKLIGRAIKYYRVDITEVVSGGAIGVDKLGEKWLKAMECRSSHSILPMKIGYCLAIELEQSGISKWLNMLMC